MSDGSVLIVAGEASADMHGAQVLAALKARRPQVTVFGIGGAAMREHGLDLIAPAEHIAVAGLTEVLLSIPRIWSILRRLTQAARERRPSLAVLIDLPDFNLRLAKRLRKLGVPVVYYISPQVWAWRRGRVEQIRRLVAEMLVVLPFEATFYEEHNVPVRFVGHPLVDELPREPDTHAARQALGFPAEDKVVALLPGSRRQEVLRHLPGMLEALTRVRRRFPEVRAVIPVASTIPRRLIEGLVARAGVTATVLDGRATEALVASDAAVVCSGTATLQAALLLRPMVVIYKVSWLTYQILKRIVHVAHIALVNLIAGKKLVPELVQSQLTPENLASELLVLLADPEVRARMHEGYTAIRERLGGPGAAERVADVVIGYLPKPPRAER